MRKWISLLAVLALLTAFAGCGATPPESLTPMEELYREREQLAQPVLEEYERRLDEAVRAAKREKLVGVRINHGDTVTDKALINRLLATVQEINLAVDTNTDTVLFGEENILFGATTLHITFVYEDEEIPLGGWSQDRMYIRYPAYPDAPDDYIVTNLSPELSQELTALETLFHVSPADRHTDTE